MDSWVSMMKIMRNINNSRVLENENDDEISNKSKEEEKEKEFEIDLEKYEKLRFIQKHTKYRNFYGILTHINNI